MIKKKFKNTIQINYVFDVDGTLTESRKKIEKKFEEFFLNWIHNKNVYLVSGSDYKKTLEQLGETILANVNMSFNSAGNSHYKNGELIYYNNWSAPDGLINFLMEELENSTYPVRAGNHIEERIGMVNFSIIGRNCTQEQRIDYFHYDNKENERNRICKKIMEKFPDLEAVVGGQISIDIYKKGKDKGQILDYIGEPIWFFGDRVEYGGNDYCIAKHLYKSPNRVINVKNWKETYEYLKKIQ